MEQSTEDFHFVDVDEVDDKVGASDMGAVEGVSRSIEEEKREKKRRRTTKPIEVLDMAGNAHSLTHLLTHSLIYLLTHLTTYSLTHSLTHLTTYR
jgi:hypothetical protein